jgi:outer membrane protein
MRGFHLASAENALSWPLEATSARPAVAARPVRPVTAAGLRSALIAAATGALWIVAATGAPWIVAATGAPSPAFGAPVEEGPGIAPSAAAAAAAAAEGPGAESSEAPPGVAPAHLTLEEAINTALERNHGLMAATERTRGSRARVHQAVAAFLPSLSFSSTYIRADGGRTFPMHYHPPGRPFEETVYFDVTFIPERQHDTKFQITQPVFTGGRLFNQLKLARAEGRQYSALERSARQDLILEVRRAYMDVLKARENEKVVDDALELAVENVRAAESLAETGKASRSDVLRARVQEATAEQDLLTATNYAQLALENLSALLDVDLRGDTDLRDVQVDEGLEIPPVEECVRRALDQVPDVEAARRAYDGSSAALSMAKASFFPTISLQADYGWTEEHYRFAENAWAVYTILSFDIFKGTDRMAKVSEASARKEETRQLLKDTERRSILRVKQSHFNLQEAAGRRRVAKARLDDAEEAFRMIRLRYETQLSTQLEVLDAQVSLTAARMEEVSSRYDYMTAWDDLLRAMGEVREVD